MSIQNLLKQNLKKTIPNCNCGKPGEDSHTCPYSEEIGGDSESLCNCCDDCQYQCAMDI